MRQARAACYRRRVWDIRVLIDERESAYSAEDDRLFRGNVTGHSAGCALGGFSTLVGHDRSRFRRLRRSMTGTSAHCSIRALALALSLAASRFRIDSFASRWMR